MKYSVETILKNGAAVLADDDGNRLTVERERFANEPVAGMLCVLTDGLFRRDERAEDERRKEASALLSELLGK